MNKYDVSTNVLNTYFSASKNEHNTNLSNDFCKKTLAIIGKEGYNNNCITNY